MAAFSLAACHGRINARSIQTPNLGPTDSGNEPDDDTSVSAPM